MMQDSQAAATMDCQNRGIDGETLHLVHEGRFCCPGGDCDAHDWLVNEGGLEPHECAARCKEELRCGFMTFYSLTGYCQLSEDCEVSFSADDLSAQTYAFHRSNPHCATGSGRAGSETSFLDPWCWPYTDTGISARHCAAVFHLRATDFRGEVNAPEGSAAAAGAKSVEEAMVAASRHLEWLELPSKAHAWSCLAASKYGSEHGQLLCAALLAESWEEHPRNLTGAAQELQILADHGSIGARITAYSTLAWSMVRFLTVIIGDCHIGANGVICPDLHTIAMSWGVDVSLLGSLEQIFTTALILIGIASLGAVMLICFLLRR
jgi:hypothetical protein